MISFNILALPICRQCGFDDVLPHQTIYPAENEPEATTLSAVAVAIVGPAFANVGSAASDPHRGRRAVNDLLVSLQGRIGSPAMRR